MHYGMVILVENAEGPLLLADVPWRGRLIPAVVCFILRSSTCVQNTQRLELLPDGRTRPVELGA